MLRTTVTAAAAMLVAFQAAYPCSTFVVDAPDGPIFARNYDWSVDDGLVVVNLPGLEKRALVLEDSPAVWTSRYGSVTFNQYGRELPCGGINEAGLVIEVMWLPETEYAPPDRRPAINNLQWIQYHLDTCATTEAVLESAPDIRIASIGGAKVHYLVCDAAGHAAALEVLDGRTVAHAAASLPAKALTNSTYADSVAYLKSTRQNKRDISGTGSLDRFARAARFATEFVPGECGFPVVYAFDALANLANGDYTKWSVVYDIARRRVYWRTLDNPHPRYFDLDYFGRVTPAECLVLDMNAPHAGLVNSNFRPYTAALNRALVFKAFKATDRIEPFSEDLLAIIAAYPETLALF